MASQYSKIQVRRGTNDELRSSTLVLASGEPALALDTNTLKTGDGSSTWASLPVTNSHSDIPTSGTAQGEKGQTAVDSNYLYVCYDTNQWKKISLSAF